MGQFIDITGELVASIDLLTTHLTIMGMFIVFAILAHMVFANWGK